MPLWCDGSWGSIFSYERRRFFRKWPRPEARTLVFAFGQPLEPDDATVEMVRDALLRASSDAVGRRFTGRLWTIRRPPAGNPAAAAFRAAESESRRRPWINGHQIGRLDGLPWRTPVHVLEGDLALAGLASLLGGYSVLFRSPVRVHREFDGTHGCLWVGGNFLREVIHTTQITAEIVFHDFGSLAAERPVERAGLCHCPALAVDGMVVAMSMPHPPPANDNFEPLRGHKPRSWGKLLPGWHLRGEAGSPRAHGPAAPPEGLPLPTLAAKSMGNASWSCASCRPTAGGCCNTCPAAPRSS